jgi:hypothetical protein
MSVVGCSGEEFCSILKALGFRRERRKLAPAPHGEASAPEGGQETATAEAPAEIFDEIWRPGRRKEAHHERHERRREPTKPRREERGKAPQRERQRPEAQAKHEAKRERERKAAVEHSPFAALEGLRRTLAARQAEKS